MQNVQTEILALALDSIEGVGRVTVGRILSRFASADELRETPREQVLVRLPGIAGADRIVEHVKGNEFGRELTLAAQEIERLRERRVRVITCRHPGWPARFSDLDWSHRPSHLFVFGDRTLLARAEVAFLAQTPLEPGPYENAQRLLRRLLDRNVVVMVGMNPGFDTVACKLATSMNRPLVLVADSGLARVPGPMRPAGAAAVNAGGAMVSSFQMTHGPFEHDRNEGSLLRATAASTVVFAGAPEGSAERRAVTWARENGRTVVDLTQDSLDDIPEDAFDFPPPTNEEG